MLAIGYKLCGEEQSPQELIDCARRAEEVGAAMLQGRFILGVGSGENLNEHILGDHWPEIEVRKVSSDFRKRGLPETRP
jgi:hypothetical protein